jgi:hypothetical protein
MKEILEFIDENKKVIKLNGYAFIDDYDNCIIIVYGEGRRDAMSTYLNSNEDPLGIKYKCITLP